MAPRARIIESRRVLGRNVSEDIYGDELLKKMTAYIKKKVRENDREFLNIAKGDIVIIESESGYRNTGKFIWNGKKVVDLYTEVDDYGSVPPEIEITDDNDFDAYSWYDLIEHNNFVWYSPEIRDRIKDSLNNNLIAQIDIRGTLWTFRIVYHNTRPTLEDLKRALDENRVIFNAAFNSRNIIEMYISNEVHGTPRRRARATTSRRTTGTTRRTRNAPVDAEAERAAEAERQRVANVARIEAELAAARENVVRLERQLAAARIGGSKRHHKK